MVVRSKSVLVPRWEAWGADAWMGKAVEPKTRSERAALAWSMSQVDVLE
jgi:hypothetical protein